MTDIRGFEESPYNSILGETSRFSFRDVPGYRMLFVISISTRPFGICPGCVKVVGSNKLENHHWAYDAPDWSLGWASTDPGLTAEFTTKVRDDCLDAIVDHVRRCDKRVPQTLRQLANNRMEFSADVQRQWRSIVVYGSECPNCHHALKYVVNPYEMRGFWSCRGWPDCEGPGKAKILPPGPGLLDTPKAFAQSTDGATFKSDNTSFWERDDVSSDDDIPF